MVKKTTTTAKKNTRTSSKAAKKPANKPTKTTKVTKTTAVKKSTRATKSSPKRSVSKSAANTQKVDYYPNRVALLTATAAVLILLCLGLITTQ